MYFNSRKKGKHSLPWFDSRTDCEKSNDEYFEELDDLAQHLDDVESDLNFYTTLSTDNFDSGYEYVYARIKELKEYITEIEFSDELDSESMEDARESLQDIYEDLVDLYDSALIYDDHSGSDPDDSAEDWDEDNEDDCDDDDGDKDDW